MNLRANALKVKFKNAVMQVWTQMKRESQPKNISTLIAEMLDRRKRKLVALGLGARKTVEEDEANEEQKLKNDSEKSYFSLSQYTTLNKRISEAHFRMKEQQLLIDGLDKGVADAINKIRERQRRLGSNSTLTQNSSRKVELL